LKRIFLFLGEVALFFKENIDFQIVNDFDDQNLELELVCLRLLFATLQNRYTDYILLQPVHAFEINNDELLARLEISTKNWMWGFEMEKNTRLYIIGSKGSNTSLSEI
jgi:hypothetical protein